MWGNQCLQINVLLNQSVISGWFVTDDLYNVSYSQIPVDVMWPIAYIRDFAQVSDQSAKKYLDQFNNVDNLQEITEFGTLTLGIISFIAGCIATAIGAIQLERTKTYDPIN